MKTPMLGLALMFLMSLTAANVTAGDSAPTVLAGNVTLTRYSPCHDWQVIQFCLTETCEAFMTVTIVPLGGDSVFIRKEIVYYPSTDLDCNSSGFGDENGTGDRATGWIAREFPEPPFNSTTEITPLGGGLYHHLSGHPEFNRLEGVLMLVA